MASSTSRLASFAFNFAPARIVELLQRPARRGGPLAIDGAAKTSNALQFALDRAGDFLRRWLRLDGRRLGRKGGQFRFRAAGSAFSATARASRPRRPWPVRSAGPSRRRSLLLRPPWPERLPWLARLLSAGGGETFFFLQCGLRLRGGRDAGFFRGILLQLPSGEGCVKSLGILGEESGPDFAGPDAFRQFIIAAALGLRAVRGHRNRLRRHQRNVVAAERAVDVGLLLVAGGLEHIVAHEAKALRRSRPGVGRCSTKAVANGLFLESPSDAVEPPSPRRRSSCSGWSARPWQGPGRWRARQSSASWSWQTDCRGRHPE